MAKIQRLKISTDEKMSMLRGQPGHMPAAPAAAESAPLAAVPEPIPVNAPEPVAVTPPVAVASAPVPVVPALAPVVIAKPTAATPAPSPKRGRGRPPKAEPTAAEAAPSGLQPSLIRLEGETQRAALAYIHEELMLHSRRVYLKELVDEAVNYYLQHGPPAKGK
ncbi:hypothetical protein [Hymenobacter psychrotolerans]|uniref:hypothetical protein n=1 Tax=Hymenobacter psychrotolerans TaxID=344998 RepID=UPI0011148EC8|nr:hypothetical protein [Hymenobacter psychrotolerans]